VPSAPPPPLSFFLFLSLPLSMITAVKWDYISLLGIGNADATVQAMSSRQGSCLFSENHLLPKTISPPC